MGECCGTCNYYRYDFVKHEWICANENSEYEGEWVDYGFSCEERNQ